MTRLFGTDGIRGKVGDKITGDIAYRLGNTLGAMCKGGAIVVGRDTRRSGVELYKYLKKGILDSGSDIINMGIVSTPIVSYTTLHTGACFGVVITASHNTSDYNGLKVFNNDGTKIGRALEETIESDMNLRLHISKSRGKEMDGTRYIEKYENMLISRFSRISGLNIGIDTANGALSNIAPSIMNRIFGSVTSINADGNGDIINDNSGALHPEVISDVVRSQNLDMGFAFDGDGDRIVAVLKGGKILSGDQIIYAIATYLKKRDSLAYNTIVGTLYTNVLVEKSLGDKGITLLRSDVGDSNVASMMRSMHLNVGGERAGHIILSDIEPTGDGLLVALFLASILNEEEDLPICEEYEVGTYDIVTPLYLEIAQDREIKDFVDSINRELRMRGRVLLRASGTEEKLRIMVESGSSDMIDNIGSRLRDMIYQKYSIRI